MAWDWSKIKQNRVHLGRDFESVAYLYVPHTYKDTNLQKSDSNLTYWSNCHITFEYYFLIKKN